MIINTTSYLHFIPYFKRYKLFVKKPELKTNCNTGNFFWNVLKYNINYFTIVLIIFV